MGMKKKLWGLLAIIFFLGMTVLPERVLADGGHWVKSQDRWWYQNDDNTYPASEWLTDNGKQYYFDSEGWMVTGWKKLDGKWYLFAPSGEMLTGWQWSSGKCYYLAASGVMAADTWIENYYVDQSGAWVQGKRVNQEEQKEEQKEQQESWVKSGSRWWYRHSDGGYTSSGWEKIGGTWYYFDSAGWMATGWQKVGGSWYYLTESGAMATGWQKVGGSWYYLTGSGAMATGWQKVGGSWYYLTGSGAMATGWQKIGGSWYYLTESGAMATGWQKVGGSWYYLTGSGAMATGWQKVGGSWYYLSGSGAMLTGWQWIGGKCYYLTASGAMAANTWIGGYYVDGSGAWVPNPGSTGKKLVAIDAGHQAKGNSSKEPMGPGSSQMKAKVASGTEGKWSGLKEYELTLQVSLKLRDELQARGYQVYMIRETHDVDISNAQRAQNAANAGADILVRVHANGDNNSSVYGALTMAPSRSNSFLSSGVISASQSLSQKVVDSFCQATGAKNRGVMTTDTMSGINWSTIPVTIIEMGFMTNQAEDLNMASSSYQDKMVQGIANGIDQYYESGM